MSFLGDTVHEADDLMDEFNTEALRRQVMPGNDFAKQVRTFFSASNQLVFRHKMGSRIREIKKKLDEVGNRGSFLGLVQRSPDDQVSRVVRNREREFYEPAFVIGRDEDRDAIIKLLLESQSEENVLFIPIVGMGGLGKTTLAHSVFNDERVKQHFEPKAWVCVSDTFDVKVIVKTIADSEKVELIQLQQDLKKKLGGKRYLLVLDDLWEENRVNWLKLEDLLIGGAKGSRVVVTTRSQAVAEVMIPRKPYQLGILDGEKSWSLFKKMAFRQGQDENNSDLVGIGKEIVKRCGGNPLAIRVIGSALCNKSLASEWSSFNQELSKLQQVVDILPTLRLSYDNLTSHLKHCFAYCRLFPKDCRIDVRMLVQLWMAQGLLKLSNTSCDQSLEDVGRGYFEDLFQRSFFQEIEIDEFGDVESCKMHDLIHDLAIEVAGQEYLAIENSDSLENINKNTRHLSFYYGTIESQKQIPTLLLKAKRIQTVVLLEYEGWANNRICDAIVSKCKQTRALDFKRSDITMVPDSIRRLKFVRYLDLSGNSDIKTLPNSIASLLNLQTLKLNHCSELQQLPRDIKKLVNLRHLEIDGCRKLTHMPVGLGQLTNLTTLSMFVLPKSSGSAPRHSGELKELMGLNNLRGQLKISNLRYAEESVSANLKEKKDLRSLYLQWDFSYVAATEVNITRYEESLAGLQPHPNLQKLHLCGYRGVKIPSWLQSLTNLVSLSLYSCERCKHPVPTSQFCHLKDLVLVGLPSLEYITNSYNDDNLRSSLKTLYFYNLPNLKGWWRECVVSDEENKHKSLPSFPQLTTLTIEYCPKLTCMPLFPHLEGDLYLDNASSKPFLQTMSETSSFSPLSKVKTLKLDRIEDLECLPDSFKSLSSLQNLTITGCSQLKDLCKGILCLTSLTDLRIENCKGLIDTMNNEIKWKALNGSLRRLDLGDFPELDLSEGIQHVTSLQHLGLRRFNSLMTIPEWIDKLSSLKSLSIWDCPNLTSLPEGIRSLTSLTVLTIVDCPNLASLPEGIRSLTSLTVLTIVDCPNLTSLPEGIRNLTSLEDLTIWDCPILLKRCQRQIGEDWPKIAHIPQLSLRPDPNDDSGSEKWKLLKSCVPR